MTEETKFVPENWDKEVEQVELVLYNNQNMRVTSQAEYDAASDFIKQAKTTINIVEAKRKRYTVPLDEMKKSVMEKKNAIVKPLEDFIIKLGDMQLAWYKQEQARVAEEQKRIDAEALEKAKLEHQSEVQVPVLEVAKTARTGFSTATVKKFWTFKVVDQSKVPAEFLWVNEDAVKTAINDGARSIAGLEIYEELRRPSIR